VGTLGIGILALVAGAIAWDGASGLAPAALVLGAAGVAALGALHPRLRPARGEALGLAGLWCGLALLQLLWAGAADAALEAAAVVWSAGAVFLVAGVALPAEGRERWLGGFAVLGTGVAVFALASTAAGAEASRPFGNPNRLAAFLLLPAAVGLAGLGVCARREHNAGSVPWFGGLAVCAAGLAATGSLGAGLACVAATLAVVVLSRAQRGAGRVAAALAAGAGALVVLPLVAPEWIPWARDGSEFSPGLRWRIYGAAARAALDVAPWGVGLGGFADAFAAQRPGFLLYAPRHAHNEPLHALVELGLPFALALAASVAIAGPRVRALASRRDALAGWSALAAGLAIGSHALVDAPLRVPAVGLGLAALAGLAFAAPSGSETRSEADGAGTPRVRTTRLVLASLALLLAAVGISGAAASLAEDASRRALARGGFAEAERIADAGGRLRPARVALWRLAADAAEHAARLGDGGPRALERALAARRGAVASAPRRASLHAELADTLLHAGNAAAARAALAEAARLNPAAPGPHLARARIWLAEGAPRRAADAAREAVVRHPLAARGVVAELLRATGDSAVALAAVPEEPEAFARAARELARAGHPRAAADAFERALALDPGNVRVAVETARSWRRAGRADRAAAVLSRALDHAPGDPGLRGELARAAAAGRGGSS